MTPEKRPGLIESTFVERDTTGSNAIKVLKGLESPISAGLRDGVKRITGKSGCPTSKFVMPSKSGDKALELIRNMESPIAAGLRDGGKESCRHNL